MKGFLLDEHLPRRWRAALIRRIRKDVRIIGDPDAPPRGSSDRDLLLWCEGNEFVLVTEDHRTIPRHVTEHLANGRHVPGVLILQNEMRVRDVLEYLDLFANATGPEDLRDLVQYIPYDSPSV